MKPRKMDLIRVMKKAIVLVIKKAMTRLMMKE